MVKVDRVKELVDILNKAGKAYYQEDREIMSNLEYDKLYDELTELEKETGIVLSNSPTINVGYEILSELEKEPHSSSMLSLDKTKDINNLTSWLGDKEGVLSWKLDGLTVVITYREGELYKAVTRGDGEIGEVITNNAKTFKNLPKTIPYKGELIIRGEAIIKYSDFNILNDSIENSDDKYKNPRNLCSGSVRQLNNEITAKRNVHFFAFNLVGVNDVDFKGSFINRLEWLSNMGFDIVEYVKVSSETLPDTVMNFANRIPDNDLPSDGLVLMYDDIEYGKSLGRTSKFPRDSIAFKWADELATTHLTTIEWSPSRTGLINPIAVFEPVELEGTSVSRASLHNVSILETLALGIGDEITVYKANMIIPQVAENITRSGGIIPPSKCPACEGTTQIKDVNGVRSLYCTNPTCSAKKSKLFTHFVSRNAINIDGMSEATIDKFIEAGFLSEIYDIYRISKYESEIVAMDGFGEKSYNNLIKSINNARVVNMAKFVFGLGILNIGLANAKVICREFKYDFEKIRTASLDDLIMIEGIGEVIGKSFVEYFEDENNNYVVDELLKEVEFESITEDTREQIFEGKNFVITGSVNHFANRNEIKELIESKGGKVTGSVTRETDYLINNDVLSNSSKNKKAKELGVTIISEEDFIKLIN